MDLHTFQELLQKANSRTHDFVMICQPLCEIYYIGEDAYAKLDESYHSAYDDNPYSKSIHGLSTNLGTLREYIIHPFEDYSREVKANAVSNTLKELETNLANTLRSVRIVYDINHCQRHVSSKADSSLSFESFCDLLLGEAVKTFEDVQKSGNEFLSRWQAKSG